jgi:hypothetical protein
MTADANSTSEKTGRAPIHHERLPQHPGLRQFPGLVAISLYMFLLAAFFCYSVVTGRMQPLFLIFSVFFVSSSLGLLFLMRWAWALALAAVALLSASFFWTFSTQHSDTSLVQGLLNLIFFLYLVRSDLREKMR